MLRYAEHELQKACVKYFRYAYPKYVYMLFSVPNGGQRTPAQCRILKEEGLVAGVSDLILLISKHGYGALCIEMKTKKGYQEPEQKVWQQETEKFGNKYVVIRSFDEFRCAIKEYLDEDDGLDIQSERQRLNKIINK